VVAAPASIVAVPAKRQWALNAFQRDSDDYEGLPTASLFRPIYAFLQRAQHEAAERLRKGVKTCSKCDREGPLEDFNADPRRRDGKRAECRECQRHTARDAYVTAASIRT
jgi:hypothetical protein